MPVDIPQEFRCSITGLIMAEPVTDRYEHTYEKDAIEAQLSEQEIKLRQEGAWQVVTTSPLNRQPLRKSDLRLNTELLTRIQHFLTEHKELYTPDDLYLPESVRYTFVEAVKKEDSEQLDTLLSRHPHALIYPLNKSSFTLLHFAASKGKNTVIDYLLNKGVDVNLKTSLGVNTALNLAVTSNNISVVKNLLARGADVHTLIPLINDEEQINNFKSPLTKAVELGNVEMVALLLKHGAFHGPHDTISTTPLHIATQKDSLENRKIIELLLAHGADAHRQDIKNTTPVLNAYKIGGPAFSNFVIKEAWKNSSLLNLQIKQENISLKRKVAELSQKIETLEESVSTLEEAQRKNKRPRLDSSSRNSPNFFPSPTENQGLSSATSSKQNSQSDITTFNLNL